MDVKTVCLGMLDDGEASGYDLKKQFESTFAHFFAAGYGSIYPALSSLAEAGLVNCREIAQDGKPDRKVYRITTAGREHLLTALQEPAPSHKLRSEFLATMCFAHLMTPEQIQIVLANRVGEIKKYMAMFDELESTCVEDWPNGMRFVCGFGRAITEATQKYVEENRDMLIEQPTAKKSAAV